MTVIGLTSKMDKLYSFIKEKMENEGVCPSYAEMRDHMGLHSKNGVHLSLGLNGAALKAALDTGTGTVELGLTDDPQNRPCRLTFKGNSDLTWILNTVRAPEPAFASIPEAA